MRPVNVLTMILAGGIGERLYPLTSTRSKPAVPFGGNFRIIDFTLMNCLLSGLRQIHLLTQYYSTSLGRHKNQRWNFLSPEMGEFIELVPPKFRTRTGSCSYQGTADAIYRNLDLLERHRPDVVLILSGDHIYRADYRRFIDVHLQNDADITVLSGAVDTEEASSFGVIEFDETDRIRSFVEKPEDPLPYARDGRCQINLGVYCFQTDFLVRQLVRDGKRRTHHDFGKNILPESLDIGRVHACPHEVICPDERPYWRDVGTIDSYYRCTMDLLATPSSFDLRDPRWPDGSRFQEWLPTRYPGTPVPGLQGDGAMNLISQGCDVAPSVIRRSVLSPGARVEQGAEIEECILFPGVRIGAGARLRQVIVEENVVVPAGTTISPDSGRQDYTISRDGVAVVPGGYRFDTPSMEITSREDGDGARTRRQKAADRGEARPKGTRGRAAETRSGPKTVSHSS